MKIPKKTITTALAAMFSTVAESRDEKSPWPHEFNDVEKSALIKGMRAAIDAYEARLAKAKAA